MTQPLVICERCCLTTYSASLQTAYEHCPRCGAPLDLPVPPTPKPSVRGADRPITSAFGFSLRATRCAPVSAIRSMNGDASRPLPSSRMA